MYLVALGSKRPGTEMTLQLLAVTERGEYEAPALCYVSFGCKQERLVHRGRIVGSPRRNTSIYVRGFVRRRSLGDGCAPWRHPQVTLPHQARHCSYEAGVILLLVVDCCFIPRSVNMYKRSSAALTRAAAPPASCGAPRTHPTLDWGHDTSRRNRLE